MLVAVERQGAVRSALVDSDKAAEFFPWVEQFVQKEAQLMIDENRAYYQIGKQYDCYADIGTVSLFVKSRARPTSPTVSKWRNLLPHFRNKSQNFLRALNFAHSL